MDERKLTRPTFSTDHLCVVVTETGVVRGGEVLIVEDIVARLDVSYSGMTKANRDSQLQAVVHLEDRR